MERKIKDFIREIIKKEGKKGVRISRSIIIESTGCENCEIEDLIYHHWIRDKNHTIEKIYRTIWVV